MIRIIHAIDRNHNCEVSNQAVLFRSFNWMNTTGRCGFVFDNAARSGRALNQSSRFLYNIILQSFYI